MIEIILTQEQKDEIKFQSDKMSLGKMSEQMGIPKMRIRRHCHENGIELKYSRKGQIGMPKQDLKQNNEGFQWIYPNLSAYGITGKTELA